jgi:nucleotide-binding universal stress UspA family protein
MYANILVATDGSDLAGLALDHAVELAKRLNAKLTIVTVSDILVPTFDPSDIGWGVPNAALDNLRGASSEQGKRILAAASERAKAAGMEAELLQMEEVPPYEGILTTAREIGADLVVVASHGRRGLSRLILGSQANKVLTLSDVPVLVVKQGAEGNLAE